MSPAHELALALDAAGVGEFAGQAAWSIHVSKEPKGPDEVITLYDSGGGDTEAVDVQLRAPRVQVRVRAGATQYAAAIDKHEQIHDLLVLPLSRTIGDHHYVGIWLVGDFEPIGRDESDRHLITANYRINRQPLGELT